MPWLCLKCDSRVEPSIAKPGVSWCPGCEKELGRDEIYRVGKRFSAGGAGAMMAMIAAGALMVGTTGRMRGATKPEATNTFMEMGRQKRKKIHGLKKKQRRHARQKRRK